MAKPRIYFDRELDRWVADNGYETCVKDSWGAALQFAAVRWYGPAGLRWVNHGGLRRAVFPEFASRTPNY